MKVPALVEGLVSKKLGVSLVFAWLFIEVGEPVFAAIVVVVYLVVQGAVDMVASNKK